MQGQAVLLRWEGANSMNDTETVRLGDKARDAGEGLSAGITRVSRDLPLYRQPHCFKSSLVFLRLAPLPSAEDGPWCP